MNKSHAFFSGIIGGLAVTFLMWVVRRLGITTLNLELNFGSIFIQSVSYSAVFLGLFISLIVSGLIALVYAWGFEYVSHRSGAPLGATYGTLHALIGGLFLWVIPSFHPLIPGPLPELGAFAFNYGAVTTFLFIGTHLLYGAIVGAVYEAGQLQRRITYPQETKEQKAA